MRGSLGRLTSSSSSNNSCLSRGAIAFSTFPGGGGGRGRGRGSTGPPNPQIGAATTPGKPNNDNDSGEIDEFPSGLGHGRGKPLPSNPILPSFSSWMSGINPSVGRGRTNQEQQNQQPPPPRDSPSQGSQSFQPKKPIFFRREDLSEQIKKTQLNDSGQNPEHGVLPSSISSGLPGAGRGKSMKFPVDDERANEENRHLHPPQGGQSGPRRGGYSNNESQQRSSSSQPRLSREDAVKKAVGILSRAGGGGSGGTMEESERGGRGFRGRGGRGRGMVGRRGGRGGRGRGGFRDADDDYASGLYLGDNADGERLANKVGVENMDQLTEAFEEMSTRVLPSPMDDAYLDAVHTNNLIEYEPEYLMGDFGTNPDIDDKPPISLRDALEKVKPFLMAYEGIKDQEEWEKVMKETMDKLPVMKELIDIYSGPDRVTAKQQIQELERVAKTLPENVPSSVKRYTDRAVLSLQVHPWFAGQVKSYLDKLLSNGVSYKRRKEKGLLSLLSIATQDGGGTKNASSWISLYGRFLSSTNSSSTRAIRTERFGDRIPNHLHLSSIEDSGENRLTG